ncbi:MAG: MFS transporter [Frankiaceae bacterium]|jgi:MFS family permease|nr:MFS transporter [Frankiaceae bacterium]
MSDATAADDAPPAELGAGDKGGAGMFRSLRVRNYRLYAAGQLVSLTGTWMQRVAIDWLVLDITHSGSILGLVTMLQFAPSLLLGPFGGLLADRVSKRRLLICTQTGISACAMLMGLLVLTGLIQLWQVMLLATCLGIITAIDAPGRQSFVVEMVGAGDLQNAVALNSAIFNSGRLLGPSIGGAVIAGVGTGWAFVGNSVFTLAVVMALFAMRPAELSAAPLVSRGRGQLSAGMRYVAARRAIWIAVAMSGIVGIFGQSLQLISALLARVVFHGDANTYARLTTALAIGAFLGALAATRRSGRPTIGQLARLAFAFGAAEACVGLMPTSLGASGLLIVVGFFMITFMTASNASVQLGIEPTMRGRVMSIYMMSSMGGSSLGGPLVGRIAQQYGARAAVMLCGAVVMVTAIGFGAYARATDGRAGAVVAHDVDPADQPADQPAAAG